MHKPLFLITAGSVAACGALIFATASPAAAAETVTVPTPAPACTIPTGGGCANTPVTFSVTSSGVLAITAPTITVDLGSGVSHLVGSTIGSTNNFGAVTVTDNRGLDPAIWTATVSSTDFINTSTGVGADTIPAADATYTMGVVTPAGLLTSALADGASVTLSDAAQPVVTQTGFDGDNAATWTPTIDVAVPAGAVIGVYYGTLTHSVS
jgi:hypothetical protein